MVAGWRLPFSAGRDRKAATTRLPRAAHDVAAVRSALSPLRQRAPAAAIRACARIISAAIAGASAAYDRPAPELSALRRRRRQVGRSHGVADAPLRIRAPTRASAVSSRHYRPRTVQFQRTHHDEDPGRFPGFGSFLHPRARRVDPRLKSVHYEADKVVPFRGASAISR